jgi:arginyl-tRNA synthetase
VARLHSLLKKVGKVTGRVDYTLLREMEEKTIIKYMSQLPDVIEQCVEQQQPSALCTYAIGLAQAINSWYHKHDVSGAPADVKVARVALATAAVKTLERALALLTIETVEEM